MLKLKKKKKSNNKQYLKKRNRIPEISSQSNISNESTNGSLPYGRPHELQSTSPSACSHWTIHQARKEAQSRDKERDPNSP